VRGARCRRAWLVVPRSLTPRLLCLGRSHVWSLSRSLTLPRSLQTGEALAHCAASLVSHRFSLSLSSRSLVSLSRLALSSRSLVSLSRLALSSRSLVSLSRIALSSRSHFNTPTHLVRSAICAMTAQVAAAAAAAASRGRIGGGSRPRAPCGHGRGRRPRGLTTHSPSKTRPKFSLQICRVTHSSCVWRVADRRTQTAAFPPMAGQWGCGVASSTKLPGGRVASCERVPRPLWLWH
jgi:hypothetical protein